jgi:hypothetical protein
VTSTPVRITQPAVIPRQNATEAGSPSISRTKSESGTMNITPVAVIRRPLR